ncbi:contact-dependent growth inhibition system immunity protein [Streptomyces sp. NPDC059752]|uniref:contact-dependent growth inhibition system immunity protein n=1 Tax=unclassified Streptomyces TaxID=2593676 RepID=UPI00364F68A3
MPHPESGGVAQLRGELSDLLSLPLQESDYALALSELGMEVDPPAPFGPGAWLSELVSQLRTAG